jgi:hypothetical protein
VGVAGVRAMVLDGTLPSYMLTLKARTALDIPVTSEDAQT